MTKASPIQNSFNAGELSRRLEGRTDLEKYRSGCRTLENFIPMVHGGLIKRSGTRFVKEVKTSADGTILVPFEFSTTQAYILEFGDLYMRVYKDNGAVLETAQNITNITAAYPAAITITGHGYSTGQEVYIAGTGVSALDNQYHIITVTTPNDFTVPANGTGWSSGGTASRTYELATTYLKADLPSLQFAQSADVLYVAHNSYSPRKISRTDHDAWTITTIDFDWQPFLPENLDDTVTIYVSAATGAGITVTASAATFTANMVNGYIKLREVTGSKHNTWATGTVYGVNATVVYNGNVYQTALGGTSGTRPPIHEFGTESDGGVTDWAFQHPGEGYAKIVGYTSPTVVTADVVKQIPGSVVGAGGATFRWSLGAWSTEYGYPKAVAFYEDRLLWAGSLNNPQTIWGSKSGDYENHRSGVNDDDAYVYTIATDQVNAIEWMSPGKVLVLGTAGGEFVMSASALDEAITPTNIRITRQTTYGSKQVRPLRIANAVLFTQRSGRKLRELTYSFDSDAYQAVDTTLLAEHITKNGIVETAYQQEPNQIIWVVRGDGVLLGLTYEKSEDVVGWHRHLIAGNNARVESIASIPHPEGDKDQLWMIVKRTINGATKRYIEYLEKEWEEGLVTGTEFFVDSGLSYDGSPVTTLSGLDHLEGESVTILADGSTHPNKIVSSGAVILDRSSSKVQIGLGYTSTVETMRLDDGAADGTAQGKTKRITKATFRLDQTGPGLWYGPNTTNMEEIQFRDPSMAMDAPVPLFNGDKGPQAWPGGYEMDGRVALQHRLPLPCSILAIMPQLVTQDR